jgi:hypothetical protein
METTMHSRPARRIARIACAPLAALVLAVPAQAAFESAYTDLNLDDCLLLEADDFGASWSCPGYKGFPMRVAEGDLRFFVSYGFGAADEPAAEQTLPPFNVLGPRIEWRLSNASGRWLPVATIVRYATERGDGGPEGEVLVVTQILEGATCHVAYVDARANPDANQLARDAADAMAGTADCTAAPEIIGDFEAW